MFCTEGPDQEAAMPVTSCVYGNIESFCTIFVSAFRRANDLAMAMEARCYRGGEGRTKMKPLHYQKRDRMAYLTLLVYLAAVIGLRILWINVLSGMAAGILPGAFPL